MERDYGPMMDAAADLQEYRGYLDTQGAKQRQMVEARFVSARNRFVYDLLQEGEDAKALYDSVARDLDEIEAASNPGWEGPIDYLRENLLPRIEKEARKSPWLRKTIRWTPAALGVAALCAYLGIRFLSAVEVTEPLESREGLEQRASAASKVIRYDEWMSANVRRGGWLKGILFWPIEPTEEELRAAQQFASLTLDGHQFLVAQGQACGSLQAGPDNTISDQQIDLIGNVAAYLKSESVSWQDPPLLTVLEPIKRAFPC